MRLLYEFLGAVVWVCSHPIRAAGLFLYVNCKPLWRYFYKKHIEAEAERAGKDRMLLSSFRRMVQETQPGYRVHVVSSSKCKLIRTEDELELIELDVENIRGTLWVYLPREI